MGNGKGFNGSTINYFVVGTRFASLNSSFIGRAALSAAVIKHNFGDLKRGGSSSYMAHNRRQAFDTGQYWSGIGFNAFRDQSQ